MKGKTIYTITALITVIIVVVIIIPVIQGGGNCM